MKQLTHISAALATSIAVFRPQDLKQFTLLVAASTIGGIVSDVDVTTSESHKELEKIIIISFISIVLASIAEVYLNIGIFNWLQNNIEIAKNLGLILIFFCIVFWGMHQPHRSCMHSLPCTILLSGIVYLLYAPLGGYFGIGMLSHIILDLLNKKKVQLFYPLKFKGCLYLCESNGFLDKIICKLAMFAVVIECALIYVN